MTNVECQCDRCGEWITCTLPDNLIVYIEEVLAYCEGCEIVQ